MEYVGLAAAVYGAYTQYSAGQDAEDLAQQNRDAAYQAALDNEAIAARNALIAEQEAQAVTKRGGVGVRIKRREIAALSPSAHTGSNQRLPVCRHSDCSSGGIGKRGRTGRCSDMVKCAHRSISNPVKGRSYCIAGKIYSGATEDSGRHFCARRYLCC